ncbi:MAG: extracellular solute-binding protein, partial [Propionibacteriaceae bacterium]|nr:extracellular solute-binding protein [Propionibacteriaceae bacterium]
MKHTKILAAGLAATLALGLTACGGGSSSTDTPSTTAAGGAESSAPAEVTEAVTITMLAAVYSDKTQGLWQGFIDAFEQANPNITINLEMQSWDNINDVIRTKVQAGQQPDILSIDAFSSYVADGLLYSADEILSPATIADFQESFVENATMDGKQYGFPLIASARALFYNDDLFEAAGLDPTKDFATWDEMYAAAEAIAALGNGVYGYGMPLGAEENQAQLGMWAFTNGGSLGDSETLTINDPKNVEAAEYIKKMVDAGLTEPDAGSVGRTPLFNNVFSQGKIGMMIGLPQFIGLLAENAPDLNYSIHPHPGKEAGQTATLGVADHLMVFNNGDEAKGKAAGAFIDFFYQADNYVKFVDEEGFLPTTKSGAAGTTHTEFAPFNDLLPVAKFYPSTNPSWGSAQGLIQESFGTIATGADPQAVLDEIQT